MKNRYRKRIAFSLALIAITVIALPFRHFFANAEEDLLPQKIETAYSETGNYLPTVLSENYYYEISVYDLDDTEYVSPIAENVGMKYSFAKPGEYVLKYTLHDIATHEISYEYTIITVMDMESPVLFVNGAYKDWYAFGEQIPLLDVVIYDNADADLTEFSYRVLLEKVDVTSKVSNDTIIAENGSYEIIYSANDKSGNEGTLSVFFNAGIVPNEKNNPEKKTSGALIGIMPYIGVGLGVICLGVGFSIIFMIVRKRRGK